MFHATQVYLMLSSISGGISFFGNIMSNSMVLSGKYEDGESINVLCYISQIYIQDASHIISFEI